MPPANCPDDRAWRALLAEAGGETEELVRHLEMCAGCQRTLEVLAAEPAVWEDTAEGLVDTARGEGALRQIVERLKTEDLTLPEGEDLSFLDPTDKPGLLGLLGRYEVQEVIGRGGFGIVLKAFEPALNRLVAIKVLSPALAGSATARRRFTREAQAAAAVCHDHVVAVHGVHEAEGISYIVMQYIAGESLQVRLDRCGPLEVMEVVRIGMQTAEGLAAAHAQGLIHRDVKPANLLLENGLAKVKITDFGLARMTDDVGLTRDGTVAGTPEYMAPEQARGEAVDYRADLFSLGSVLYACCTGVPPFRGPSMVAVLRRVSDEEPVPVRSLNPQVPAWLEEVIMRLMAKDPAERLPSAREVAVLLENYLAHLRQPTEVNAPGLPARPRPRTATLSPRHVRPLLWLMVLLLLAAIGILARLMSPGGPPPHQAGPDGRVAPARGRLAFDFRAGMPNFPALFLEGPDVDEVAKADAQGLRVTLPEGRGDTRPIIVRLEQRLRGDFEITLGYELLAVGKPVPQYGAGVGMRVWFDAPSSPTAVLGRSRVPTGERFGAHKVLTGADDKEQWVNSRHKDATRPRGRVRLVRSGSQLRYLIAEDGQNWTSLLSVEMGTEDVKTMQVHCHTMFTPISLDVRLTELVIDADQFPGGPEPDPATPAAVEPGPPPPPRKWLLALGLCALIFASFAAVGWWILVWQNRRAARELARAPVGGGEEAPPSAAPAISFPCSDCGKRLKARVERSGQKVKCPGCGRAVLVPPREGVRGQAPDS
jgi:hypothetical protein